ncbi:hypothetical protein B0T25DRAFT_553301 [Lasiosphaeria hispida]|uniref:Uncharacterized protein n=1 Tax=Lasiosphaeria hispida TaxID=260671 RepID=A0AAJ0MB71_9PEZI|nr:hypothetical protein B0T25DRAFT_553301 [Lasiosphaeria hispida]
MPKSTTVTVYVIAVGGKFLGDDVGGAEVTIRDVRTREILTSGVTRGDSGPPNLMCVSLTRSQSIIGTVTGTTSTFEVSLSLASPMQIEVTAYGPLAARGSANTVSATSWIYPGKDITAGNGILLEMPGLVCQIISPPTHTVFLGQLPFDVPIVANVAMMCGCPISVKAAGQVCSGDASSQPWLPDDFDASAVISGNSTPVTLSWDAKAGVAGRFTGSLLASCPGTYQVTVYAQQKSTGNTGVDLSSFIVPKPSSPWPAPLPSSV